MDSYLRRSELLQVTLGIDTSIANILVLSNQESRLKIRFVQKTASVLSKEGGSDRLGVITKWVIEIQLSCKLLLTGLITKCIDVSTASVREMRCTDCHINGFYELRTQNFVWGA